MRREGTARTPEPDHGRHVGSGRPRWGGRLSRAFEWARRWRWARCLLQRDAGAGWLVQRHARRRRPSLRQDADPAPADKTGASGVRTSHLYGQPETSHWRLQATLPGAVIKDISFASPTVGYSAAELGRVWKTTDGGNTWTRIMNLGYPYYWYGDDAPSEKDVVISGFDNSNWRGLLRWSHDGGQTWSSDVVLTTQGWSNRVRFADDQHGLVINLIAQDRRDAHYTTTGGQTAADWTATTIAPWTGWFGNQFSLLPNLRARVSGIHYCDSLDGGASWSCIPF